MWRTLNADVTYTYFNMQDPVVGGYEREKVALRRAMGLAINIDQEIRLFWRGRRAGAVRADATHDGLRPRLRQ
jgi:hypothetical protein